MSVPRATMRLQFHRGFPFDAALAIVPYLADLGVSHLYASPILTARAGSMHGYDVVDPSRVNPELGGEAAWRRLVGALRTAGLGVIVDMVPNHMAVGNENPWWLDVLRLGRSSPYAGFFDIDWEPDDEALNGKVCLPILGRPYGEALAEGEIKVVLNAATDRIEARYYDHILPIDPRSEATLDRNTLASFDAATPEGRKRLHALLERQNFRLSWWRSANDEINWRRFFDINELAAIRVEDDAVFEATHAKLFGLYADGLIDGVRVDHVDGLADPGGYCRKLRARLEALLPGRHSPTPVGAPYIVVEKILGAGEELPRTWGCDGTSGYDFMDQVSAVLHDPAGETGLTELWQSVSGRAGDFEGEEILARRELLDRSFSSQLAGLVSLLHGLARADLATRDITRATIRRATIGILVGMRVYRTYGGEDEPTGGALQAALARARRACLPADRAAVDQLGRWFADERTGTTVEHDVLAEARRRFRQLSAPLAAKAVEDTALYRYGRLLSRLDVGFDANCFADTVAGFHARSLQRLRLFPHAMLATATHDHKRGADVRARLAVLSEIPAEWRDRVERWMREAATLPRAPDPLPAAGDIAILFQMIVGAWPLTLSPDDRAGGMAYRERLAAWQAKALREAKLATDWTVPDEAYERSAQAMVTAIFDAPPLLADIAAFVERIAPAGAVNGLTQTLLHLTAPGMPDLYQGTEFWDFSLVDPDNRRSVDFAARVAALAASRDLRTLADCWRDGRIKQQLIRRVLAIRKDEPALFADGDYLPLATDGPAKDHVIGFARRYGTTTAITLAARRPAALGVRTGGMAIPADAWQGTTVELPPGTCGRYVNALTGEEMVANRRHGALDKLLTDIPVAFLYAGTSQ